MFISSRSRVSGGLEQEEPGGKASGEPDRCLAGAETPSCPVCLSKTPRQSKAGEILTVKPLFSYIYKFSVIVPRRQRRDEKDDHVSMNDLIFIILNVI